MFLTTSDGKQYKLVGSNLGTGSGFTLPDDVALRLDVANEGLDSSSSSVWQLVANAPEPPAPPEENSRTERETNMSINNLHTRDVTTRIDANENRIAELMRDLSLPVPMIAATEGRKDDGLNLNGNGWILSRFKQYGPILHNHFWWEPTLGRGLNPRIDAEGSLRIDTLFDRYDSFAVLQRGKVIQLMSAGSVGFAVRNIDEPNQEQELWEFSIVTMPMDNKSQMVLDGRSVDMATVDQRASDYALAIRSMANVEMVQAFQRLDMKAIEDATRAGGVLLEKATAEEIVEWMNGADVDQLDIVREGFRKLEEVAEEVTEQDESPDYDDGTRIDAGLAEQIMNKLARFNAASQEV
jgi:hypothetical protein